MWEFPDDNAQEMLKQKKNETFIELNIQIYKRSLTNTKIRRTVLPPSQKIMYWFYVLKN